MSNLLVELFVEELPPKALKKLDVAFAQVLAESLQSQGLINATSVLTHYATPRRLAVHIANVLAKAADEEVAQKLMPVKVGLDADGNAMPALLKRLNGMGLDVSAVNELRTENDGKTDNLFIDMTKTGVTLNEGLQKAIEVALSKLPIPKVMTYQIKDGWETVNFVRPAHGLVALHDDNVIPISVLGLTAGNTTVGHRFESHKETITINSADTYAEQLRTEGAVIANFIERKENIAAQLKAAADQEGLTAINDDDLLDEVTALVELPNVLVGQFETAFLEVPQECLVLTMKANQKYFPLLDSHGKLSNKFLIVSNINPEDPSAVIGGNERVVRPRLADAKFFFDQDRKKTLESRTASLNKVVYHNKLGSQGERNNRVTKLAGEIAEQLGGTELTTKAVLAARLSKADLVTDMVGEFPELQGIMGRYYAQHEGIDDEVAFAIEDHYKPRFAGDELPRNAVGICVALADKLETLVGLFSIGEKPTGDKDPFALRRQALGIIRMLMDAKLPLKFDVLIQLALSQFDADKDTLDAIEAFCYDRLSVSMRDQGASAQEVEAVLSVMPDLLSEVPQRLAAVQTFATLPEAPALAAANKRVGNILRKVEGEIISKVDSNLLKEPQEISLAEALSKTKPEADKLFETGDYTASLQTLAVLKQPVDAFFDNVMVNAEDPALKANRLGLLATLHQTMNRVADLSKLAN
ncbi:MAG TPA: glycine--tRNA ligase subunit beta [Methylophilaceae bacterium]|nr:glycine--tRNA ligase subunit beta [Methylophilaceae bacterium]